MKTENIQEMLNSRNSTHGTFTSNAYISQSLKGIVRLGDSFSGLTTYEREALDMILHKIARIVSSSDKNLDNWRDVIGYTQLVINELQTCDGVVDVEVKKKRLAHGEWVNI